jgi:hypothetical protein
MNAPRLAIVACGIACLTGGVNGQSVTQYRNFPFAEAKARAANKEVFRP